MGWRGVGCVVAAVLVLGCGGRGGRGRGRRDAGAMDAGRTDAGRVEDGGSRDAGPPPIDVVVPDAGVPCQPPQFCPEGGPRGCTDGVWAPCETCNGVDDDADGEVDESLLRACTDGCTEHGFQDCISPVWSGCTDRHPFDLGVERGGIELDEVTVVGEVSDEYVILVHSTAAFSNRLMLVGVATDAPPTSTAVEYDGIPLTPLAAWTAGSTFVELHVQVFYLLDPPAVTADVTVALGEVHQVDVGVYTMGNVAGAPRMLGSARERSTSPRLIVDASPGGLIVDFLGKEANHLIIAAPESELGWDMCGPGYARFASSMRAASGPTMLSWEYECCSDEWVLGAVLVPAL